MFHIKKTEHYSTGQVYRSDRLATYDYKHIEYNSASDTLGFIAEDYKPDEIVFHSNDILIVRWPLWVVPVDKQEYSTVVFYIEED